MGQLQREAIEGGGYTPRRVANLEIRDHVVGPFFAKPIGLGARILDVAGALVLLIFTAPLVALIVLLVKLQDGGPIIFTHRRIGHGGQMFTCFKVRTMVVDADERLDQLLATDPDAHGA